MRMFSAVFDWIVDIFAYIAAALIAALMVLLCLDIVLRSYFNRPIIYSTEMAEYGLFGITFLCVTWVLKHDRHVTIDFMLEKLSPRSHAVANVIIFIICAIACLGCTWFGARVTLEQLSSNIHFTTGLAPPTYPFYLIITLNFLLLFGEFTRKAFRLYKVTLSKVERGADILQDTIEGR